MGICSLPEAILARSIPLTFVRVKFPSCFGHTHLIPYLPRVFFPPSFSRGGNSGCSTCLSASW